MGGPFDQPIFNPNPIFPPATGHPWDDQLAPMRHGGEQHAPIHGVDPADYNSYQDYQDALARESGYRAAEAQYQSRSSGTATSGHTGSQPSASAPLSARQREQLAAEGRARVDKFVAEARQKDVPTSEGFWFNFRRTILGNTVNRAHSLGVRGWMINGYHVVLTDGRLVQRLGTTSNRLRLHNTSRTKLIKSEGEFLLELWHPLRVIPFEDAPSNEALSNAITKCLAEKSGAWLWR